MEKQTLKEDVMTPSVSNLVRGLGLGAIGLVIGSAGIYVGDTDDAPGAALMGLLLMIGLIIMGVKIARRKA